MKKAKGPSRSETWDGAGVQDRGGVQYRERVQDGVEVEDSAGVQDRGSVQDGAEVEDRAGGQDRGRVQDRTEVEDRAGVQKAGGVQEAARPRQRQLRPSACFLRCHGAVVPLERGRWAPVIPSTPQLPAAPLLQSSAPRVVVPTMAAHIPPAPMSPQCPSEEELPVWFGIFFV